MFESCTDEKPAPCRRAQRETHPSHLAMVATLLGLDPPKVETARVLEIGCREGENLIPMADALPGATFVGIDPDSTRIQAARELAQTLGITRAEWLCAPLDSLDTLALDYFDYVLISENLARLPDYVVDLLLGCCQAHLAENGVAYVCYSAMPGSAMGATVRSLAQFASGAAAGDVARVREIVQLVANEIPDSRSAYARQFREEAERLIDGDFDGAEDFPAQSFRPLYYHELERRAGGYGLRQLADSRLGSWAFVQPSDLRHVLEYASEEFSVREQLLDYLRNRRHRRSLLVRGIATGGAPTWSSLAELKMCALYLPLSDPISLSQGSEEFVSVVNSERRVVTFSYLRALLASVVAAWPSSIRVRDAVEAAGEQLARENMKVPPAGSEAWTSLVVQACAAGLIDLHVWEPPLVVKAGLRPRATSLARHTAPHTRWVVNLRHQAVALDQDERRILPHLDGQHDRSQLISRLLGIAEGLGDDGPLSQVEGLDPTLDRLARRSLLLA